MLKISIIIPVYKVEKYLKKCLNSCINQTLKNIEIIVVNDASPDDSDIIMREYERKYPDLIKCIYLKQNVKQGGARNRGIEIAQGEYILFVDSDDWIATDMCDKLYISAISNNSDIVVCDFYKVFDGKETHNSAFIVEDDINIYLTGSFSKEILFNNRVNTGPGNKLYKREVIGQYLFPEGIVYEDLATTMIWSLRAQRVSYLAEPLYYYLLRENSTTNTHNYSNMIQHLEAIIRLVEGFKKEELLEKHYSYISEYILWVAWTFFMEYIFYFAFHDHKDILKLCEYIKYNFLDWKDILNRDKNLNKSEKVILYQILCKPFFINKLNERNIKTLNSRIIIWGTGVWGRNIITYLKQFNVKPVYIIDSNISLQNKTYEDIEITSFEQAKDKCDMIIVAIKDLKTFEEIKEQIEKYNKNIIVKHYLELFILENGSENNA